MKKELRWGGGRGPFKGASFLNGGRKKGEKPGGGGFGPGRGTPAGEGLDFFPKTIRRAGSGLAFPEFFCLGLRGKKKRTERGGGPKGGPGRLKGPGKKEKRGGLGRVP